MTSFVSNAYKHAPNTNAAYRNGYLDGMKGAAKRGGVLYKQYGPNWVAYERGYLEAEKRR